MAQEEEKFLERWSRVKREEAAKPPVEKAPESAAPVLPPIDQLTPDSEFSPFMHPKVQDVLRRAALKKLFADPHFNIPDPYEAYSGDWTVGEAIPDAMLATLNQARTLLFSEKEKEQAAQKEEEEKKRTEEKPEDEPGRQDT